jgi:DNA-binding PadR family transcriptional regulator
MTSAELAILSILAERPYHGYEIEEFIETRGLRDWTEIGFSSIYYLLRKLEQDGYIEKEFAKATRGPSRKVYSLTPAGQAAMQAAVCEFLSTPRHLYPPLHLGLANLDAISHSDALSALTLYRDRLEERMEEIENKRAEHGSRHANIDALYDHNLHLLRAEREWVETYIENFAARLEMAQAGNHSRR